MDYENLVSQNGNNGLAKYTKKNQIMLRKISQQTFF
jgi:hypothetical protein